MVDFIIPITVASVLFSALGFSLVLKDYIASMLAGLIIRHTSQIRPGRRIKVHMTPSGFPIKGDLLKVGLVSSTLMEVGDGERLPSVRTGRVVHLPNFLMLNNPVLLYGDRIIDEVIAYLPWPVANLDQVLANMQDAMEAEDVKVIEVGLYQRQSELVVHGIFESKTREVSDTRSKVLKEFLNRQKAYMTSDTSLILK